MGKVQTPTKDKYGMTDRGFYSRKMQRKAVTAGPIDIPIQPLEVRNLEALESLGLVGKQKLQAR